MGGPPPPPLRVPALKHRLPVESASSPPPKKQAQPDSAAFLDSLPADDFTENEAGLREAILDFLRGRQGQQPLMLMKCSPQVKAHSAFLLAKCPMKDWILGRLGDDVLAEQDDSGQWLVQLAPRVLESDEADAEAERFFSSLPEDSFTTEETELKEAIDGALEKWTSKDPPNLSGLGADANVRKARVALLGNNKAKTPEARNNKGITIKMWLEKRLADVYDILEFGSGLTVIGWKGTVDEDAAVRFAEEKKERKQSGQDSTTAYLARNPHIRSSRLSPGLTQAYHHHG